MTADNQIIAAAVANKLGIDEVEAEVMPDQKASVVKRLQSQGRVVAMESAGVTLAKGDLRGIAKAWRLSRAIIRNIRQNLFFAFYYNVLGIPIAAGVLYLTSCLACC